MLNAINDLLVVICNKQFSEVHSYMFIKAFRFVDRKMKTLGSNNTCGVQSIGHLIFENLFPSYFTSASAEAVGHSLFHFSFHHPHICMFCMKCDYYRTTELLSKNN